MTTDVRATPAAGYPAEVTAANWQFPPYNRWGFCNCRRLLPTARVARSTAPHDFSRQPQALDALTVSVPASAERKSLPEVLTEHYIDGFIVLHRGRLVYERYFSELDLDRTHIVMSVSKSILSALIGILVDRGVLEVAKPAGYYVPELGRGGYGSVTLDRLLDMRSGVKYSENYLDPGAEFFDFDAVCGLRPRSRPHPAAGMYEYLATLPPDPDDPGDFFYRSTDSDVLGWVAERSTGTALEKLLSAELWTPLGCREDADLLVDPLGAPLADGGLCTSLEDLARFAEMQLRGGAFNGRQIVPERWIAESCSGDRAAYARNGYTALFPRGAYSRQWWIADTERRVRLALGIHGQMIHLDPNLELACVALGSAPNPVNPRALASMLRACAAIGAALSPP
jgi:CubicO group peptidase (beta-lactamase class C family)